MKNRALKAITKVRSLTLLLDLVTKAFTMADVQKPIMAMMTNRNGQLTSMELRFNQQSLFQNWGTFIRNCPGAAALWSHLGKRCWLNRCISSGLDTATLVDIWFFFTYIYCHQKAKWLGQNLWNCLASTCLPELVHQTGTWLSQYALELSNKDLKMLPTLRTKTGYARKLADPVNKILLLWKLRREKQGRRRVAQTHEDLGGATTRLIRFENYVDCLMHKQALEAEFDGSQVSICWDASWYGGKDVMVAVVYDPFKRKASYLMSQQMLQTMVSDISEDLIPLARNKKLTRLEGFKEIKGVNSALASIGLGLDSFVVPPGLVVRPLKASEFRFHQDGRNFIYDTEEDTTVPEIPNGLNLADLPVLVSISDQGPNVIASVNYLLFSKSAFLFHAAFDPFHRAWNDLKNAMKRSVAGCWRVALEYTLVANLNYGPFGSSTWHFKKKARLQEYLATKDINCPLWQKYQHLLCKERRIPEPSNIQEASDLFQTLGALDTFDSKGPLIKLMRWFSWFESMAFYSGKLVATKLILESSLDQQEEGSEKEIDEAPIQTNMKDPREELRALKKRKGSWKLAPELITPRSLAIKDVIMSVGKSSWQLFSSRARELVSPLHILEYNISCSHREMWKIELVETLHTSLQDERHLQHLLPDFRTHDSVLVWHLDLMSKLLETRAQSLTSFHCLPPNLYNHVLAPTPVVAGQAHSLAVEHFKILLEVEGAYNEGVDIRALAHIHWRLNPFIRALYLAYEEDKFKAQVFTVNSSAMKLQRVVAETLGDSRLIENIHQFGKDTFRSSKSKSMSNTAIMASALRSKVLEGRKVDVVKADVSEKATQQPWNSKCKGSVVGSLRSTGKLAPTVQKLMAPKNKSHTWPSPSPASLFQSVAATQWIFTFWANRSTEFQGFGINSSWLSCLAKAGSLLASRQGRVIKVLAAAEFGFLGVDVIVKLNSVGERCYVCSIHKQAIQWHYILDLDNWLELQVEGCLVNATRGPVGWKSSGDPLPLQVAACMFGITLTHAQICRLIKHCGGVLPGGTPSKKVVELLLIELVVPEEHQEQAKAHMKIAADGQDDFDTDLSEVVSKLAQDDANQQDIKDFKQKKKFRRLKKSMAAKDEPLVDGRKQRKPKAKAKTKAKAKPKPKPSFMRSLLNKAKKRMAEAKEQKEAEAMGEELQKILEESTDVMDVDKPKEEEKIDDAAPGTPPLVASGPASSSSAPADPAPAPSTPAPQRERHKTDREIMDLIQPPGCTFGISHHDHRFTSVWKYDHSSLGGAYAQKRFSRSFVQVRTWPEALEEVHRHNWEKWNMVKHQYPLDDGEQEQVPGQIRKEVLVMLKPVIDRLPELVRYGTKAGWWFQISSACFRNALLDNCFGIGPKQGQTILWASEWKKDQKCDGCGSAWHSNWLWFLTSNQCKLL